MQTSISTQISPGRRRSPVAILILSFVTLFLVMMMAAGLRRRRYVGNMVDTYHSLVGGIEKSYVSATRG